MPVVRNLLTLETLEHMGAWKLMMMALGVQLSGCSHGLIFQLGVDTPLIHLPLDMIIPIPYCSGAGSFTRRRGEFLTRVVSPHEWSTRVVPLLIFVCAAGDTVCGVCVCLQWSDCDLFVTLYRHSGCASWIHGDCSVLAQHSEPFQPAMLCTRSAVSFPSPWLK